jgi:hypothetical protein
MKDSAPWSQFLITFATVSGRQVRQRSQWAHLSHIMSSSSTILLEHTHYSGNDVLVPTLVRTQASILYEVWSPSTSFEPSWRAEKAGSTLVCLVCIPQATLSKCRPDYLHSDYLSRFFLVSSQVRPTCSSRATCCSLHSVMFPANTYSCWNFYDKNKINMWISLYLSVSL